MPLPKRVVEPVQVARGTIPEDFPLPSELEAATNGTLANTVRQLSSLSRHAEDLFGELARDAQQLYDRSNSLQARIDRLAVKVTQLDSTVEEVSLQDIQLRKAFKSSVTFDQQIFSRDTMPTAMLETYRTCDRPPPLDKLNCYRDDGKDGLKFYTDPNYFFELWRQEMIKDTEKAMQGRKPHRPRGGAAGTNGTPGEGGQRSKAKGVRKPNKTNDRLRQVAVGHGEYIMPSPTQPQQVAGMQNATHMQYRNTMDAQQQQMLIEQQQRAAAAAASQQRPNSIEIRRSYQQQHQQSLEMPDGLPPVSPGGTRYVPAQYADEQHQIYAGSQGGQGPLSNDSLYNQQQQQALTPTRKTRPTQPPPAPPSAGPSTPTRVLAAREQLPPPPPPPDPTQGVGSPHANGVTGAAQQLMLLRQNSLQSRSDSPQTSSLDADLSQDLPPPPPLPKQTSPPPAVQAPPPPPPPPMPMNGPPGGTTSPPPPPPPTLMANGDLAKVMMNSVGAPPKLTPPKERAIQKPPPMVDPRNDLLKAIRDGITLRKVEKIEQSRAEVERSCGNGFHDVASILARRVAVEFSDSESGGSGAGGGDSDCDSETGWGPDANETSA